jgi:hypothetical protein
MKKLFMKSIIIILILSLSSVTVQAQTVPSGQTPIELSVVRIVALVNGEPVGAGSGVITSANGVIFTNEHVVACGQDYLIEVIESIDQINRPPVARYLATLVGAYPGLDFAILQINRRIESNTNQVLGVLPGEVSLPFIPPAEGITVDRQDEVVIYGYPGIAGGVLQISTGQITGILDADIEELGTVTAEYQTDALIARGNSGGAAIIDGRFVGIPTAVNVDATNSVGIIRPITTALAVARAVSPIPPRCDNQAPTTESQAVANFLVTMTVSLTNDWETDRQVYVQDTRTGQRTQITNCGMNDTSSWSPDGRRIAYISDCNNDDREIWITDTSRQQAPTDQITRSTENEQFPK